jgi:hypothetical protein
MYVVKLDSGHTMRIFCDPGILISRVVSLTDSHSAYYHRPIKVLSITPEHTLQTGGRKALKLYNSH